MAEDDELGSFFAEVNQIADEIIVPDQQNDLKRQKQSELMVVAKPQVISKAPERIEKIVSVSAPITQSSYEPTTTTVLSSILYIMKSALSSSLHSHLIFYFNL